MDSPLALESEKRRSRRWKKDKIYKEERKVDNINKENTYVVVAIS
jgi:hypothetical protein